MVIQPQGIPLTGNAQILYRMKTSSLLTLFRGGDGKFAYPSADLIFRIEEKFFTAPFILLLIFLAMGFLWKKWAQMVDSYGQGETFVKGDWKISICLLNN